MTSDPVFERMETAALGALDDYLQYRQTRSDGDYRAARLGVPVVSGYAKVRGTRANERQLDIIERRFASGGAVPQGPAALAGDTGQQDAGVSPSDESSARVRQDDAARRRAGKSAAVK